MISRILSVINSESYYTKYLPNLSWIFQLFNTDIFFKFEENVFECLNVLKWLFYQKCCVSGVTEYYINNAI